MNSRATSVTRLRLHRSPVVGWFVLWREIYHQATLDFCNTIGTSRTSGDVRLESAKWAKADDSQLANYSARPTPSCQRSVTALPSARRLLVPFPVHQVALLRAFLIRTVYLSWINYLRWDLCMGLKPKSFGILNPIFLEK